MKTIIIVLSILTLFTNYINSQMTPFEKNKLTTTTYDECIGFYKSLDKKYEQVKMIEAGETDIGRPLHLVIISKDKVFEPEEVRKNGKVILFVNNGIHPGEPDGIDASMMLVRDLTEGKYDNLLDNVVIILIPIYNIDGALNRNNFTRVNQVGPLDYGFRGNYQNRDLNRDFIKCDTKNARSFIEIFRKWKPELFVDTHTTDGADYPYVMTYIATQHNKLQQPLAEYLTGRLVPFLDEEMKKKNWEMCPYVTTFKLTPDSGIVEFPETPRYSTGYASLFNTIGFVSETHMLKTHEQRVWATYGFLISTLTIADTDYQTIIKNKKLADENSKNKNEFVLEWNLDSANANKIWFKGYEAKYKPSEISGLNRVYYDKNSPWEKEIDFYNNYIPKQSVTGPIAYIVPQAWWKVVELLKLNKVEMEALNENRVIDVETYYIETFDTRTPPYEGHYQHSNVKLKKVNEARKFFRGDYIIYTNQDCNNFIVSVLEPQGVDSYFNWNFFDGILQQKEYFDPYLFEDIADSLLNSKPGLKDELKKKKQDDEKFRNDGSMQLKFIYDNTIREPEFMRYPVARIVNTD
ncbi:MAG: M14 family metallopeptidase [Chlorobi bacterium]|nr:M14 family metallopeptidase [Chlorobiota bacterium]